MTRPIIIPSVIVLAFALSSCAGMEMAMPFADQSTAMQAQAAAPPASDNPYFQAGLNDVEGAIAMARTQREARDFVGATVTLSQLVLLAPDDPRVLSEYGKTLVDRGETSDALAFLQRAIELNPMEWSNYSAQGVAFAQTGNYSAAQTAFGHALALKPNDPTVLNNFALANLQAGNLDQAEKLLVLASQSGEGGPRIEQNLALVRQLRVGNGPAAPQVQAPAPAPAPTLAQVSVPATNPAPIPAAAPAAAPVPDEVPEPVASETVAAVEMPAVASAVEVEEEAAEAEAPVASVEDVNDVVAAPAVAAAQEEIAPPVVEAVDETVETASVETMPAPEPAQEYPMPTRASPVVAALSAPSSTASEIAAIDNFPANNEVPAQPPVYIAPVETASLAEVESEPLPTADIWLPESGPIYLQLAAFSVKDNAVRFYEKLESMNAQVALAYAGEREIHSVSVGPYQTRAEAIRALSVLSEMGIEDAQGVNNPIGRVLTAEEIAAPASSVEPADAEHELEPENAPDPAPALRFSENQ